MTVLGIAGCKQNPQLPAIISPYKIDVQQGNVVSQEMVDKLKAGMTRSQVRFVLGSPLVVDMFRNDRWDYIYLLQRQGKPDDRRRLTVIFDGDKLLRVEGDVVLTNKAQEPEQPALKPPVAATPATRPAAAKPLAATVAPVTDVNKSAAKPPVAKPDASVAGKPAGPEPDTAATGAASTTAADAAGPTATKTDAKAGAAADATAADAAKADDKKDAPKQRGLFGRMLEKIGL